MTIQKKAQQGFTLIELMIVIAIVGILAAIALPAYQDYIVRSKVSEPLAALSEGKTSVAEYYAANGQFPAAATAFGVNTSWRDSAIMDELDVVISGSTVYIVAEVEKGLWGDGANPTPPYDVDSSNVATFALSGGTNSDGTMSWTCVPYGAESVPTKYLPANYRG